MARLPTNEDEKNEQQNKPAGSLLGGYLSQQATPTAGALGGGALPMANLYGTNGSGPSATGYVNFDRIYAANEATANRDASKMGQQAAGAAQKAQQGLGGLQQQFSSQSVNATGRGPTENDVARSKGAGTAFYTPPPTSSVASKLGDTVAARAKPGAMMAPDSEENWLASMKAQAGHKYTGPNSLQDVDGFKGLLADYGKADNALRGLKDDAHIQGALEQNATAPSIEGGTRLDAALIGQAGRPEFARVREQYKGIGKELGSAVKDSAGQGERAMYEARVNAAKHRGLLSDYGALTAPVEEDDAIRIGVAGDKTLGFDKDTVDAVGRNSMFTDGNPSTILAKTFDDYGNDAQGLADALGISVEDAEDALKNPQHKADIIAGRFSEAEVASRKAKGL